MTREDGVPQVAQVGVDSVGRTELQAPVIVGKVMMVGGQPLT